MGKLDVNDIARDERPDCMPNPIEAIKYVPSKRFDRVRLWNKESKLADKYKERDRGCGINVEIGTL